MISTKAFALLVHAVLPGTEALQVQSRSPSEEDSKWQNTLERQRAYEEDVRMQYFKIHPVFSATYKSYTKLHYAYNDGWPVGSKISNPKNPKSLETLDRFWKPISDLEVFAVECPDLKNRFKTTRFEMGPRWFWTDRISAESKLSDQEDANADLRAEIPSVEEDIPSSVGPQLPDRDLKIPEDKFRIVRESLEYYETCNILVKARLEANLFEVTGPSLRAIIEDKELGKQIVTRWNLNPWNPDYKSCTWANVLRLSFGVGCGYAMYDKISAQCDNEEIELEKNCRDDYSLTGHRDDYSLTGHMHDESLTGHMHDENGLATWNNRYMEYAVHILKKAKGATGMLIKYDNADWADEVAIWELEKDNLTQKVRLN